MKFSYLLPIFVCLNLFSQNQDLTKNYIPLKSSGKLPDIYTQSAAQKTNNDIATLNRKKGETNKSDKRKFYLESNFYQDKLLRSGRILFGDPISNFVNKVADEVFRGNPELRSKLQIFVVKSNVVNAFCFDNGIILLNSGLIAQLDNEAQLASILCHEASHFTKKHSIESFVTIRNESRKRYSDGSEFDEYQHSKESELEADVEGAKLFKNSNYSYKGVVGAFNLLKYAYLPFDEVIFDKSFLEDSNLVFPNSYFLKETASIKKEEEYDDAKSTHPNIKKRKEAVSNELGAIDDSGREKFLVSQTEFNTIRELARFESCRIGLLYKDYVECVYNNYLLLKKYPKNVFLKTTLAKALFQIAAYKSPTESDYNDVLKVEVLEDNSSYNIDFEYDSKEGNSQQVYHLFNKLNATQSTALALNYTWKLKKELNDTSKLINQLCDSLFVLAAVNNKVNSDYFRKVTPQQYLKQLEERNKLFKNESSDIKVNEPKKYTALDEIAETDKDSKIGKIENQKVKEEIKILEKKDTTLVAKIDESEFERFAFVDFFKQPDFVSKLSKAINLRIQIDKKSNDREGRTHRNRGGLGIDSLVILDPFYVKLDERKRDGYKYFASDEKLDEFGVILKNNADLAGLKYAYIDSKSLKADDIDVYNDFTLFNDWKNEFLYNDFHKTALVLNNNAYDVLRKKYNTNYVLWNGIVNTRMRKEYLAYALLGTVFIYPAPFTIPYLLRKEYSTYYLSVLFDLKTNQVVYYKSLYLKMSDTEDFLNAFTYDVMNRIKTEVKYKK